MNRPLFNEWTCCQKTLWECYYTTYTMISTKNSLLNGFEMNLIYKLFDFIAYKICKRKGASKGRGGCVENMNGLMIAFNNEIHFKSICFPV